LAFHARGVSGYYVGGNVAVDESCIPLDNLSSENVVLIFKQPKKSNPNTHPHQKEEDKLDCMRLAFHKKNFFSYNKMYYTTSFISVRERVLPKNVSGLVFPLEILIERLLDL